MGIFKAPNDGQSIERYSQLFAWMMSSLQVLRKHPTDDAKNQLIHVPVFVTGKQFYMQGQRDSTSTAPQVANTLPRGSITFTGMQKDELRQAGSKMQRMITNTGSGKARQPYDFSFTLDIKCKNKGEAYQLWEMISSTFNPYISIKVKDQRTNGMDIRQQIDVVLDSVDLDDTGIETDLEDRREITLEATFTIKGYVYDTAAHQDGGIINRVAINLAINGAVAEEDWIDERNADYVEPDPRPPHEGYLS